MKFKQKFSGKHTYIIEFVCVQFDIMFSLSYLTYVKFRSYPQLPVSPIKENTTLKATL